MSDVDDALDRLDKMADRCVSVEERKADALAVATVRKALEAATPDWSKCNCGAGPYGIHAKWCALALARLDQLDVTDQRRPDGGGA